MIQQHAHHSISLKRINVPGVAVAFRSVGYNLQKYFCLYRALAHAVSEATCAVTCARV